MTYLKYYEDVLIVKDIISAIKTPPFFIGRDLQMRKKIAYIELKRVKTPKISNPRFYALQN